MQGINKSIIKTHADSVESDWANQHISMIKGRHYIPRRQYYENLENGDLYSYISGGFAWPGKGNTPGFSVVVAVMKTEDKKPDPPMKVLAEVQETSLLKLIHETLRMRDKYCTKGDPEILDAFWGDDLRFDMFLANLAERLERKKLKPLTLMPPPDLEQAHSFEIFFTSVDRVLVETPEHKLILELGDNPLIINALEKTLQADSRARDPDQFPAVAALGYVIHAVSVISPWEVPYQREQYLIDRESAYTERMETDAENMMRNQLGEDFLDDVWDSAPISDDDDEGDSLDDYL